MPEHACYLFVNKNLKMSTGKSMVQSLHCHVELVKSLHEQSPYVQQCYEIWSMTGHKTVVLYATPGEMNELYDSFRSVKIHDAGRTEVAAGSFTMLALYPKICDREEFKHFKLVN